MNTIELMKALFSASSLSEAAKVAIESGLVSAKEMYIAYAKESGVSVKEANEKWKAVEAELKPKGAKAGKRGFADAFYDWLAEDTRSEQEAYDLIAGNESANVRNHLTHYLNIWALAETIRQGRKVERTMGGASKKAKADEPEVEAEPEWEYNDADPFADVASAWENLKREAQKARPRKTRLHPDKVAKFGDDALTAAYNHAFQVYCQK